MINEEIMMINDKLLFSKKEIDALMDADSEMHQLIQSVGEINRHGFNDPFIGLVNCIVYQQISFKAANSIWKKLIHLCHPCTPKKLQGLSDEQLKNCGLNKKKISYIREITNQVLNKSIDLDQLVNESDDQVIKYLTEIKGIGPWSARMFLIFSLKRKNIMSYGDLGIRRGLQWLYGLEEEPSKKDFKTYYNRYFPHNTLASFYLWEITIRNYFKYASIEQVKPVNFYDYYKSPFGWLELKASNENLIGVSFVKESKKTGKINDVLEKAVHQLEAYFSGNLKTFNLPVKQTGTRFQKKVWSALEAIPYGETKSYKDIAKMIDHPKAYRAVGGANNKNEIPIIIPCHRVVGSSGKLTGYAGGLRIKEWLLNHENKHN